MGDVPQSGTSSLLRKHRRDHASGGGIVKANKAPSRKNQDEAKLLAVPPELKTKVNTHQPVTGHTVQGYLQEACLHPVHSKGKRRILLPEAAFSRGGSLCADKWGTAAFFTVF